MKLFRTLIEELNTQESNTLTFIFIICILIPFSVKLGIYFSNKETYRDDYYEEI